MFPDWIFQNTNELQEQNKCECVSESGGKRDESSLVSRLALTLALFQYPEPGSNRHSIAATGV